MPASYNHHWSRTPERLIIRHSVARAGSPTHRLDAAYLCRAIRNRQHGPNYFV
jgi:hypothetical protein